MPGDGVVMLNSVCSVGHMRQLVVPFLAAVIVALPAAGQGAGPCAVPDVPITTHPDRPVPRDTTHRYHDDWRKDRWVVRLHGNTKADTIDTIRAPYIDEWTPPSAPHRRDPLMSPDRGWEIINTDQQWDAESRYRHRSATYLFYNKYSGTFRPLMFFREPSTTRATHYAWAASTRGVSTVKVSGIVHSPLDREAVDSNLWTTVERWGWHALPLPMRIEPDIWVSGEFESQYEPCHCDLNETIWFNFYTARVQETTLDGQAATITYGPYLYHGIATYVGGHDTTARPWGTDGWLPFYDVPFGTWTLLRTPTVACDVTSEHILPSGQGAVTMRMRTTHALLGVVNPHVFDVERPVAARLAYVLCIRGTIDNVQGMRRLNDTLWATDAVDAGCANSDITQVQFAPRGDVSYGAIRLAVTPVLIPRDPFSDVRTVETTSVFATKTMFADAVTTLEPCDGWRLARQEEIAVVCADVDAVPYDRRRRRSHLPAVDTISPRSTRISVDVTPNPASDVVVLHMQQAMHDQLQSIEIVDVQGKRMRYVDVLDASARSHRVQLDVSSLSSGIYQIVVRTAFDVASSSVIIVR